MDNREGWKCPTCGKVYAPWMPECTKCPPKEQTASTDDNEWTLGSEVKGTP